MSITVKDLRDALTGLPDDMPVILQKDSEGDGYSPCAGCDGKNSSYAADSTCSGNVGFTRLTDDEKNDGYDEDDVVEGMHCFLLWPVN